MNCRAPSACLLVISMLVPSTYFAAEEKGKWKVSESRSAMDDSRTVTASLRAENYVPIWLDRSLPLLTVRCKEGSIDVYMSLGSSFSVDNCGGELNQHRVRIRYDKREAFTSCWSESTDDNALFPPSARTYVVDIVASNTMRIEFTPFNASPVVAEFDVRGLSEHITKFEEACPRWAPLKD